MGEVKWMQQRPFGVMVHYLKETLPRQGEIITDWDKMTESFSVENFADEIERMGAGWVIFPFGQNSGYYCSPNAALEAYAPGSCSKRDLMREIAIELKKRDIKLIAYLPSEVDANTEKIRKALDWDLDIADKSSFQKKYQEIIRTWSKNLSGLIDGWWFDGCYDSFKKDFLRTQGWTNERFKYTDWKAAACAGNPDTVIAMNPGAENMEYAFKEQDYLGGEANTLHHKPNAALIDGMQWHCLVWLDCFWMHTKNVGEIEPPRFSDEELCSFYSNCKSVHGAFTWNIGIYQDGKLAEKTVNQILRLKKHFSKEQA